jgi:hypothetical protein
MTSPLLDGKSFYFNRINTVLLETDYCWGFL